MKRIIWHRIVVYEKGAVSTMTEVQFFIPGQIPQEKIQFVVCAARYHDKWVFSRHKDRNTWDMPGGHREVGETLQKAMERELWEETGSVDAEVQPVRAYSVCKEGKTTYGMLYHARIRQLGCLPEAYEMAEIRLSERMPEALTYPDIQPHLFSAIQGWLNSQSNAGELWDVYDENRNLTGRIHRRGEPMAPGDYHLVVHVWMLNSQGEFLLTKRSPNKGFPNVWESTGGSALAGDDSLTAALREVKEETGLVLDPSGGERILFARKEDYLRDVWLFRQDFDLADVVLQPGETVDKMYADKQTILQLWQDGVFVPYDYIPELMDAAGI